MSKATIHKASDYSARHGLPVPWATKTQVGTFTNTGEPRYEITVEIETLADLARIAEETGESLIVAFYKGEVTDINIYDDYIE